MYGAQSGTWTRTPEAEDFESSVSTIPPSGHILPKDYKKKKAWSKQKIILLNTNREQVFAQRNIFSFDFFNFYI